MLHDESITILLMLVFAFSKLKNIEGREARDQTAVGTLFVHIFVQNRSVNKVYHHFKGDAWIKGHAKLTSITLQLSRSILRLLMKESIVICLSSYSRLPIPPLVFFKSRRWSRQLTALSVRFMS
jgi:hypothetical protein